MNISSLSAGVDNISSIYKIAPVIDVLRLDLIHPIISGNKWFKLKKYLEEAEQQNKKTLLTFGGVYSNHIVAAAAAAQLNGLKSIGIIRGEMAPSLSHSLVSATEYGMNLYFVQRDVYKQKHIPPEVFNDHDAGDIYIIPEGGYGKKGMTGATEILQHVNTSVYTHIICAVGTGTTLAGMIMAESNKQIIGIPVLKNNYSLQQEINNLLPEEKHNSFQLFHQYHFGGYARYTKELADFMNECYASTGIPTDFVYTAKAFYAAFDLVKQGFFRANDAVLLIHSGGLQGNFSMPKGTLIFG